MGRLVPRQGSAPFTVATATAVPRRRRSMLATIKRACKLAGLSIRRLGFHLLFKRKPGEDEFCNSKLIYQHPQGPDPASGRRLVIVRCGAQHGIIDDGEPRSFDIALNAYATPNREVLDRSEYVYSGGINKYKAAAQFLTDELLEMYDGFMFLDDDLEITYSHLNGFFDYCSAHKLSLAQPSLTRDSFTSHAHLLNQSDRGQRIVSLVEVMCPFFTRDALRMAIRTFGLSESTWGLDTVWPKLLGVDPVVVDEFTIRHLKPMERGSAFYRYMKGIGVSPRRELTTLSGMSVEELHRLMVTR